MTTPLRTRLALPTALVAVGLALAGCTADPGGDASGPSAAGYQVTIESCGQEVTFTEAPSRVVLGNYRTLATLEALGVDDAVTGVVLGPDDQGQAPDDLPAGIEIVSPDAIPATEPVLAADPDLFISFNEAQLLGQGTLSYDDLAGLGANAYVMGAYCAENPDDAGLDAVYRDIENLGAIFNVSDRAAELNDELRARVATALASLDGAEPTVAFLKVIGDQVFAIGGYPVSAYTAALEIGNEFGDLPTAFAPLDTEQALAMTPDIVFVNYVGDEDAALADLGAALPGLPVLAAGHVYGADESLAQGSGVGIIDSLEAIAADVAAATR